MGFADFFQLFLHFFDEGEEEVAVLEHEPLAAGYGGVEEVEGDGFLALAEGEVAEFAAAKTTTENQMLA